MKKPHTLLKPSLYVFSAIAVAIGLQIWLPGQAVAGGADRTRPNFVWITGEDNSANWLSSYGNPFSQTPALDGLIADGFRYTNCFANAPVCAPQRWTWLTGMYSLSLGTHHMRSRNRIPLDQVPLYPLLLQRAGYFCTNEGKPDYNTTGLAKAAAHDVLAFNGWPIPEHLEK